MIRDGLSSWKVQASIFLSVSWANTQQLILRFEICAGRLDLGLQNVKISRKVTWFSKVHEIWYFPSLFFPSLPLADRLPPIIVSNFCRIFYFYIMFIIKDERNMWTTRSWKPSFSFYSLGYPNESMSKETGKIIQEKEINYKMKEKNVACEVSIILR
jgi:hypothetical protein